MGKLSESDVEDAALEWLGRLGYSVLLAPASPYERPTMILSFGRTQTWRLPTLAAIFLSMARYCRSSLRAYRVVTHTYLLDVVGHDFAA